MVMCFQTDFYIGEHMKPDELIVELRRRIGAEIEYYGLKDGVPKKGFTRYTRLGVIKGIKPFIHNQRIAGIDLEVVKQRDLSDELPRETPSTEDVHINIRSEVQMMPNGTMFVHGVSNYGLRARISVRA